MSRYATTAPKGLSVTLSKRLEPNTIRGCEKMDLESALKRGENLARDGRTSDALLCFERITKEHPDSSPAWSQQGLLLEDGGHLEAARECYERAIMAKPHYVTTIELLARVNLKLGNHRESYFWLKKRIGFRGFSSEEERSLLSQLCDKEGRLASADPGPLFVSYPRRLQAVVKSRVVKILQESGTEFFFDELDLPQAGDLKAPLPWRIQLGIAKCGALLLVWSPYSAASYWIDVEVRTAVAMAKSLIVVVVDGTRTPLPDFVASGHSRGSVPVYALSAFKKAVDSGKIQVRKTNAVDVADKNRSAPVKKVNVGDTSVECVCLKCGLLGTLHMAAYPTTQRLWTAVMGANPSKYPGDMDRPVENVSWYDTCRFVQKLADLTGVRFRLPSDVEWEFACRAGSTANYCWGDDQDEVIQSAWCRDNTRIGTEPGVRTWVGYEDGIPPREFTFETSPFATNSVFSKHPNEWGLWHMHGNVAEWCSGPSGQRGVLVRGGSFRDFQLEMRASHRMYLDPRERYDCVGFRICADDLLEP